MRLLGGSAIFPVNFVGNDNFVVWLPLGSLTVYRG